MAPERAARRAAVGYCVIYSLFGAVAMLHSLNASTLDRATVRRCYDWLSPRGDWFAAYKRFGGSADRK